MRKGVKETHYGTFKNSLYELAIEKASLVKQDLEDEIEAATKNFIEELEKIKCNLSELEKNNVNQTSSYNNNNTLSMEFKDYTNIYNEVTCWQEKYNELSLFHKNALNLYNITHEIHALMSEYNLLKEKCNESIQENSFYKLMKLIQLKIQLKKSLENKQVKYLLKNLKN